MISIYDKKGRVKSPAGTFTKIYTGIWLFIIAAFLDSGNIIIGNKFYLGIMYGAFITVVFAYIRHIAQCFRGFYVRDANVVLSMIFMFFVGIGMDRGNDRVVFACFMLSMLCLFTSCKINIKREPMLQSVLNNFGALGIDYIFFNYSPADKQLIFNRSLVEALTSLDDDSEEDGSDEDILFGDIKEKDKESKEEYDEEVKEESNKDSESEEDNAEE